MAWRDFLPFRRRSVNLPVHRSERDTTSLFTNFEREFQRLMDDFLSDLSSSWGLVPSTGRRWLTGFDSFIPDVDVRESDDAYHITMDLPGVKPEDIELRLEDRHLLIRGEKKEEHADESDSWQIRECRYGKFERAIPLPAAVNEDRIEAQLENGTLKIHLPKTEPDSKRGKRIEIRT
ncbi:MAG: Hsp20/alpha crystallin family protein [Lentisphaerae bacterium]|nr:MAG: Hsp20/alpha crystallin family protein [Lentisphaerota bacterium]